MSCIQPKQNLAFCRKLWSFCRKIRYEYGFKSRWPHPAAFRKGMQMGSDYPVQLHNSLIIHCYCISTAFLLRYYWMTTALLLNFYWSNTALSLLRIISTIMLNESLLLPITTNYFHYYGPSGIVYTWGIQIYTDESLPLLLWWDVHYYVYLTLLHTFSVVMEPLTLLPLHYVLSILLLPITTVTMRPFLQIYYHHHHASLLKLSTKQVSVSGRNMYPLSWRWCCSTWGEFIYETQKHVWSWSSVFQDACISSALHDKHSG